MPLIPDDVIRQIIERCDIVETISSFIALKKTGRNYKGCCPFHPEKTPSFIVNPDKQIFHCFGCGVGGNVISFVMRHERLEFPEAVRMLAQQTGIVVPEDLPRTESNEQRLEIFKLNEIAVQYYHRNLLTGDDKSCRNAREYLKGRGVKLETVEKFKLGFALDNWDGLIQYLKRKNISLSSMERAGLIIARENKEGFYDRFRNRIIFPIFDTRSNCRAFGARAMEASTAKYINSPETNVYTKGHHLYGFDLARGAITTSDFVVIVEGYMDCLMPFQGGIENVVASLGTALTVEQIRLLRRYTRNVVFLDDMDDAGQAAMIRNLDILLEEGVEVKVASLEKDEDPDSYLRKFGSDALRERITKAHSLFDYKLKFLRNKFDIASPEGKAKISSEMLPTISKMQNRVAQVDYVKRLSRELSIPEAVLIEEWKGTSKGKVEEHHHNSQERQRIIQEQQRTLEHHILKLLLDENDFIPSTMKQASPSDFQDQCIRQIVEKIYMMHARGEKIDVGKLIAAFQDENIQKTIASLVAEDILSTDKNKAYTDYMRLLKTRQNKAKQSELISKMQQAESVGDMMRLKELMQEFNQLVKI
jgi:DNA primase